MNASKYRKTRFELRLLQQGPNSFGLVCCKRDTLGQVPQLEIPEENFTDKEMQQIHDVLQMLEEKFADVYDEYMSNPKYLIEEMEKSKIAHKAEVEKLKAEAAAEKSRLEVELGKVKRGLIKIR